MSLDDIPAKFDDRPDDEVVFTRQFGVTEGLGLLMIKIAQGNQQMSLSCNNADVLKEVKRLLEILSDAEIDSSELEINEQGYPELKVKAGETKNET